MANGEKSFLGNALEAFVFPVKGQNVIILILGVIFFFILQLLQYLPFGIVIGIFAGLYLAAFLMRIIASSAAGEESLPDWPDLGNAWENIVYPWLLLAGTITICFGPEIFYSLYILRDPNTWDQTRIFLVILGGAYFPMAAACVSVHQSAAYLNPLLVLRLILKAPFEYLFACALLAATFHMFTVCSEALREASFVLRIFTVQLLTFYLCIVGMRIIGLVYRMAESRRQG